MPEVKRKRKQVAGKRQLTENIQPMLATLSDKIPEGEDWLFELKWDGFRALSYKSGKIIDLKSRNNKSFNKKFYPIHDALKAMDLMAVMDGEIVVIDQNGLPDFAALQTWRSEADGHLVFYVFDLLWLEGKVLVDEPLEKRRELLKRHLPESSVIKFSEGIDSNPNDLFKLAEEWKLEGIIAKKKDSKYLPGKRTSSWLKIKAQKSREVVIGGYTRNENSSRKISSLLTGYFEGDAFIPLSPVGTGISKKMEDLLLGKFKGLSISRCPFVSVPEFNKPSRFRPDPPKAEVTWLKPELVAEISYRTLAPDGSFRHPSFKGLREDKSPADVKREEKVDSGQNNSGQKKIMKNVLSKPGKSERKTLLNPSEKTQVRTINRHSLKFTNLNKIFWKEMGFSKRDMLNYYYQVAPFILPHVKDRPQTLNRYPNGYDGKSFYQKDVKGKVPAWIKTYPYYSEADEREKEFLVCTNEASLLYMINWGCIEVNPWSSKTRKPDHPNWCIIDLDPDKNPFSDVIKSAQETMKVLTECDIPFYCKTSGSTGLHIYIPLGAKYTYEDSKEFGRKIVTIVNRRIPKFTSIERLTSKRKGKVYLDFLQNRPQATVASVYSLRPKSGATVSMPLHPEEVKKGLKMTDFHLGNSIARIREQGDIFSGVNGKGINLKKALAALEELQAEE